MPAATYEHHSETWLVFRQIQKYGTMCRRNAVLLIDIFWSGRVVSSCLDCTPWTPSHTLICGDLWKILAALGRFVTVLMCVRLLLRGLILGLLCMVFEISVRQWEVSFFVVLGGATYSKKSCNVANRLGLQWDLMLMQIVSSCSLTKMLFNVCLLYIWLHLRTLVHRTSAYWFDVISGCSLKSSIFIPSFPTMS